MYILLKRGADIVTYHEKSTIIASNDPMTCYNKIDNVHNCLSISYKDEVKKVNLCV
jgi:hypothetical protein